VILLLLALLVSLPAAAHPAPFSYVDLKYDDERGLIGTVTVHDFDLMHEFGLEDSNELDDPHLLIHRMDDVGTLLGQRIELTGDAPLELHWEYAEPLPDSDAVRLWFSATGSPGGKLTYRGDLFPYDPAHQTFVNVYEDGALAQQWIASGRSAPQTYYRGNAEGTVSVLKTFIPSGAHHIWVGPDHLLFLLGLLLFGGSWRRLAIIVTAFTAGHTITLSLAATGTYNPPAKTGKREGGVSRRGGRGRPSRPRGGAGGRGRGPRSGGPARG
jgi:hypothetical protein